MNPFVGRSADKIHLIKILFCDQVKETLSSDEYERNRLVRVLWINGEEGIGKTSLAHELYQATDDERYRGRFEAKSRSTAYMDGDWGRVLTSLAYGILGAPPPKATIPDIEHNLLDAAQKRPLLVMLDNADRLRPEELKRFVELWTQGVHRSTLLITRRTSPRVSTSKASNDGSTIYTYALTGLSEDTAVRELLGPELSKLVDNEGLRSCLNALNGNPQKILFLRWRRLRDKAGIETCVHELTDNLAGDGSSQVSAIETVVSESRYPIAHFLALARLRVPEFSESLFAFLWDRLGGGSSQQYAQMLAWLGERRILMISEDRRIRISASVHMRLPSLMERFFGKRGLAAVDYYISQYFRGRFAFARDNELDMDSLEEYVYHAVQSGHFSSAYAYLMSDDLLEMVQYRGRSPQMVPVLRQMVHAWTLQDGSSDPAIGARLRVALAFAYNDLTMHAECLRELKAAEGLLAKASARNPSSELDELRRRLWHCAGISYSQTGEIEQCIHSYAQIVLAGWRRKSVTWFDVLTLGYIAYELKFCDSPRAVALGQQALKLSRTIDGDRNTELKNLNSLGQIYFYAGRTDEAAETIAACEELLKTLECDGNVDRREIGRVLVNSAPYYISKGALDEASRRLKEAQDVTKAVGDKRRNALAQCYAAIVEALRGRRDVAFGLMAQAVGACWQTGAFREALYGTFNVAFWLDSRFDGRPESITPEMFTFEGAKPLVDGVARLKSDSRSAVFARYWWDSYRPRLLVD